MVLRQDLDAGAGGERSGSRFVAAAIADHHDVGEKAPRPGDYSTDGRPAVEGRDHRCYVFTSHESGTYSTAINDLDLLFSPASL